MNDPHQAYIQSGMELTVENSLQILSKVTLDKPDRLDHIQHLRSNLSNYIREERCYKDTSEALKALEEQARAKIQSQAYDFNIEEQFKALEKEYASQITDVDIAKHPMTVRFEDRAREIL